MHEQGQATASLTSNGEAILVVEDDRRLRSALDRLLGAAGFCPSSFESAESALAALEDVDARCYVFDVKLPGVDGFKLYDQLVASGHPAPVIFITAHDSNENRDRAVRAGASSLLLKPFEGQELVAAILRAIGRGPSSNGGGSALTA